MVSLHHRISKAEVFFVGGKVVRSGKVLVLSDRPTRQGQIETSYCFGPDITRSLTKAATHIQQKVFLSNQYFIEN